MRISHKLNPGWRPVQDEMTPEYESAVQRTTYAAERAYAKAVQNLQRAQQKLERAENSKATAKQIRVAWELVELRREELLEIEMTMRSSPQSAQHRGRKGYRPVPQGRTL